jgi:methylamine dehydrogenase heavy chain
VQGEEIIALDSWSLTAVDEKNWRPGGINPLIADSAGVGYFLMHPHGAEGTHKDGGSEVWAYDLVGGTRLNRVALTNWGVSLGTSGTGDNRLLFVTNSDMGVDVYQLPKLEFVHTLSVGAATPFLVHGAQ